MKNLQNKTQITKKKFEDKFVMAPEFHYWDFQKIQSPT